MGYTAIEKAAIEYIAAHDHWIPGGAIPLRDALEAKHPGAIARAIARRKKASVEEIFEGNVPEWAKRLVLKHGKGHVSSFRVRHSRSKPYSTGRCWYGSGIIVVTLSTAKTHLKLVDGKLVPKTLEELDADRAVDLDEQKAVVLHEIAHARVPGGHHERFYAEWRRLLTAEGIYRAAVDSGRFPRGGRKLRKAAAGR